MGTRECHGIYGVLVGLAGVSVGLAGGSVGCGLGISVGGCFVAVAAAVGTDVILGGPAVGCDAVGLLTSDRLSPFDRVRVAGINVTVGVDVVVLVAVGVRVFVGVKEGVEVLLAVAEGVGVVEAVGVKDRRIHSRAVSVAFGVRVIVGVCVGAMNLKSSVLVTPRMIKNGRPKLRKAITKIARKRTHPRAFIAAT